LSVVARFTRASVEAVPSDEETREQEPKPPVSGDGASRAPDGHRVPSPGTPEPAPIAYRTRAE